MKPFSEKQIRLLAAILLCGIAVASAETQSNIETVDGVYSIVPSKVSEEALFAQGLGSLLLGEEKFARAKPSSKLEAVRISCNEEQLKVAILDSSAAAVIEGSVAIRCERSNGVTRYAWVTPWQMHGEGGRGRGTSLTTLSRDSEGNLHVELTITTFGRRMIFFRTRDSSTMVWLKFPPRGPEKRGHD